MTGENLSTSRIYAHAAIRREETFFSVTVVEKQAVVQIESNPLLAVVVFFFFYYYVYIFFLLSTGILLLFIYVITICICFGVLSTRIDFAQAYYIRCVVRIFKKKDRGIPVYSAPLFSRLCHHAIQNTQPYTYIIIIKSTHLVQYTTVGAAVHCMCVGPGAERCVVHVRYAGPPSHIEKKQQDLYFPRNIAPYVIL